jgi:hypothetical protein
MKRIVQFSTGLASAEVARREVERWGTDAVVLLTADTRVEDPDNWRFAHEVVDRLGPVEWLIMSDGRTPMRVGRDNRVVPSDRMDVCSRVLKRELLRRYIESRFDPELDTVVLGFDWTEPHRLDKARPRWEPWRIDAPLCEPPYVDKADLIEQFRSDGIEPPRLYAQGFQHANCYGACVRAGQAAWALLLRTNPRVYAEWEAEEELTRKVLEKDVSILSDRRGLKPGEKRRPLPLKVFRERLEREEGYDRSDWGSCNCMGVS